MGHTKQITYKTLSTSQPAYLRDLIHPYLPARLLRSQDQKLLTLRVQTSQSEGEPSPLQLPTSGILFPYLSETPHHYTHSNATSKHFTSNHHVLNPFSHLATARASDSSSRLDYVRVISTPIIIIIIKQYKQIHKVQT